jgi:hypothetical protein
MANTLTSLIPDAYRALEVVSRELVGFIPAVQLDPSAEAIGLNQTIRIPAAPANSAGKDITPAMSFPTAAYQTIANTSHALTKSRAFPFSWQQEELKNLSVPNGPGYLNVQQQQIAQALRAAINEMETDVATAIKNGASRAFGATAGTAPVLADFAQAKKILDDNGAPQSERQSVINTTAGVALRGTSNLFKVNEAGDGGGMIRQGVLGSLYQFNLRESAQVQTTTAGTGASYLSDGSTLAVGETAIHVDTGTGTILAGDIITFAGDTNKYVVKTGFAGDGDGDIVIAAPGLKQTLANNVAMTIFGTSTRNTAFTRDAVLLSTRLPAASPNDLATDRQVITDPVSGISFELALYPGYRMVHYEVSAVWGVTVIKPAHVAIIVG